MSETNAVQGHKLTKHLPSQRSRKVKMHLGGDSYLLGLIKNRRFRLKVLFGDA